MSKNVFSVPTEMNRARVLERKEQSRVLRTHGDEPATGLKVSNLKGCSPYPRR